MDLATWKPIAHPIVNIDAYDAFTLPDGGKTYVVAKSTCNTIIVLGELRAGGPVLKNLDLPSGVSDTSLPPDGARLLVVSNTDPALTVIDTLTDITAPNGSLVYSQASRIDVR